TKSRQQDNIQFGRDFHLGSQIAIVSYPCSQTPRWDEGIEVESCRRLTGRFCQLPFRWPLTRSDLPALATIRESLNLITRGGSRTPNLRIRSPRARTRKVLALLALPPIRLALATAP